MTKKQDNTLAEPSSSVKSPLSLQRREFLRASILGGLGFGAYSFLKHKGMSQVGSFVRNSLASGLWSPMSAVDIINDALRGGPSLLTLGEALAVDGQKKPGVFHVFYRTSHDIRNELHLLDYGPQYNMFGTGSVSAGNNPLNLKQQMETKAPAPLDRLNRWAYDILTTGKINGTTLIVPGSGNEVALTPEEIGQISLIAGVGMPGSLAIHANAAIPGYGNLEYVMQQSFTNYSPIGALVIDTNGFDGSPNRTVTIPGRNVVGFINSIDIPGVYMSRSRDNNPVQVFDDLTKSKTVKDVRTQMLDAHNLLVEQLQNLQKYKAASQGTFSTYGQRKLEGLTAMQVYADLFKTGLVTLGSVGLDSYDFHAQDALRMPDEEKKIGNMVTESTQALAGVFYIAKAAFAAKKDAIIHLSTCSNRSQNWERDNSLVSTLTFIIKGAGSSSPFKDVPKQTLLIADNAKSTYAEGSESGDAPSFTSPAALQLGVGATGLVGSLEAGIVKAIGKSIGETPAVPLLSPAAKIV